MDIRTVAYAHPDARALIAELQKEYIDRYGDEDETPVAPEEFAPPNGAFAVGYDGGRPVACGGWRVHRGAAEVKRMYVRAQDRGRGLARAMLAHLEADAARAGWRRVLLMTGDLQPEAVELYRSSGYAPAEPWGPYKDDPLAHFYAKEVGLPGT
ncbi:GNAT family N-acetyltransferase [Nocardiopsis suaedae]|uniref:GNAT family N-acetyltransferase n=1 Tax=Nocardiopsis suaedae TaxID=3018444 RepID=A0ABT4TP49_9ACTN|nr:GNAT family N-acetyltransferase [Nocardiopsis suaedae]MDA2806453.1 GNAT family N-acetyltransferase [Nocardiopsis suaedae]